MWKIVDLDESIIKTMGCEIREIDFFIVKMERLEIFIFRRFDKRIFCVNK